MVLENAYNAKEQEVRFYNLAAVHYGNDLNNDGLLSDEINVSKLRFSKGVVDENGGMIENYFPGDENKEQYYFNQFLTETFALEAMTNTSDWHFTDSSFSKDYNSLEKDYYYQNYVSFGGNIAIDLPAGVLVSSKDTVQNNFYFSSSVPGESISLVGLGLRANNKTLLLNWSGESEYSIYNGLFLPDGNYNFSLFDQVIEFSFLEY